MPAISVVMPVYNTEKYVAKAIESILNQTFRDYEFLIIDNGCTDGSSRIIQEYAAKDSRIRVLRNEENVFIALARNMAMDQCTGEYLYLIDSDDTAELDMLEKMYAAAKRTNAQYVVAGYYMEYYQQGIAASYENRPDEHFYNQAEFRANAAKYLTRTLLTVPWNKLYSLQYIREHNIRFRNTKLEDHHFNMDFIYDVERVYIMGESFYHYNRSRPGTDSQEVYHKFLNQKKREHFRHTMDVFAHWGVNDPQTINTLYVYQAGRLVECVAETVCNPTFTPEQRDSELELILKDPMTLTIMRDVHPDSLALQICILPLTWKCRWLCFLMGHTIGFAKKHFSYLFYKIRSWVAQKAR